MYSSTEIASNKYIPLTSAKLPIPFGISSLMTLPNATNLVRFLGEVTRELLNARTVEICYIQLFP